jgi:hypothetical protein
MTQGELLTRVTSRELSEWHVLYLVEGDERRKEQEEQASS